MVDDAVRQHKYTLDESEMPTRWYNLVADLPVAAAARPAPRHARAGGARGLRPALPDGPDPAGGHAGQVRRDPRRRARRVPPVAAVAAVPGAPPRAGPRHAGAHLLQVRGRLAGRLAQAEHRRAAGVLQRQGRREEADDRDRRGPVGHGAGLRVRAVRARVRGVAGRLVVRPEAVPPAHDRDVRRHRAPLPVRAHRVRPPARRRPREPLRLAGDRDLRSRRGRPSPTPRRGTRWAAC